MTDWRVQGDGLVCFFCETPMTRYVNEDGTTRDYCEDVACLGCEEFAIEEWRKVNENSV